MNVTLLIDNLGSGGAQRQIVLLALELEKKGYNTTIVTYGDNSHMSYMLDGSSVEYIKVNIGKQSSLTKLIRIIREIKKSNSQVLITYLDSPNLIGFLYKLLNSDVTWIPSERNLNSKLGFQYLWRKICYLSASRVVSNSFCQEKWLLSNKIISKKQSKVIWNGVYEEFFDFPEGSNSALDENNSSKDSLKFLSLGRLSHQKNPELLVSAIKELDPKTVSQLAFEWYGEEDPTAKGKRSELVKTVKDYKLPICFYPSNNKPKLLYSNSDCLILTSRYEGTPNVVLEAMASGLFVIAPEIVDLPMILGEGSRGILYKKDDHGALTEAIIKFISMTKEAKSRIVTESREFALDNFKGSSMAGKFEEVFRYE